MTWAEGAYLAGVERGEENPSLDTIVAIAVAVGAKTAALLDDAPRLAERWIGIPLSTHASTVYKCPPCKGLGLGWWKGAIEIR